jgi:23S rRNA pseudouridine1911/1915/1917 synthase
VLTVPTPKRERNTLVDLVARHLHRQLFVVHRLDRDTSGLVVFAKSQQAQRALVASWNEHERVYAAIVHGVVARDQGTIESRLVTHRRSLDRRSARAGERGGEHAVTSYRVVERLRAATLLEVTLATGRRNQIRVHLHEIGHPILGDVRYARDVAPHPLWRGGLALFALRLTVQHPARREALHIEIGLPPDGVNFLKAARDPLR